MTKVKYYGTLINHKYLQGNKKSHSCSVCYHLIICLLMSNLKSSPVSHLVASPVTTFTYFGGCFIATNMNTFFTLFPRHGST
jgi:hypothetical protein